MPLGLSRRGARALLLAIVVGAILLAGGVPGSVGPENQAAWRDGRLFFDGPSQVLAREPIGIKGGEFTIEVWLASQVPPGPGNREILSLIDGPGVRPLLLGQWPEGFLLRTRSQNPEGLASRDRYYRSPLTADPNHLAIVASGGRARLYVAGKPTDAAVEAPEMPLRGRILIGSSVSGWKPWRGSVAAVAIHERALSPGELTARAAAPHPAQTVGSAVALYRFDQGAGDLVESPVAGAPALQLPERIAQPNPPVLRFMLSVRRDWFRRDVALNLLGFVPFGFVLAWRGGRRGVAIAVASGLALSLVVELAQVAIPGRHSSAVDVISNTLGAFCGAALALWMAPPPHDATAPGSPT